MLNNFPRQYHILQYLPMISFILTIIDQYLFKLINNVFFKVLNDLLYPTISNIQKYHIT